MIRFISLLFGLALSSVALAQSSPGLYPGQVPSAAQWNSYFAAKQDFVANFGTAAYYNVGTSGGTVPLLNGANTWSAIQSFAGITATSINGNHWTTGAGTLAIGAGKTFTASNTLTLTATDGSTLAIGTGGTLGTAAYVNTGTSGAVVPLLNGNNTWGGTNGFGTLTASTFNGNTFTTGTGVLTIAAAKTLTASNTITLTATDGSTLAIGAGGTLGTAAYKNTGTSGNTVPLLDAASNTFGGNLVVTGTVSFNGGQITTSGASLTVTGNIRANNTYLAADGSSGVTGATCSAWKNGLCTAN